MAGIRRAGIVMALTVGASALGVLAAAANTIATAYPVTTWHHVGNNWGVEVVSSVRNANTAIAQANMFNDPPKAGYQYVMVKIRAHKRTSGEGNASMDLGYALLGRASHHLYSQADAVAPNDLLDADSVYKGGTVTGNIVYMVRKTDVAAHGLKLRVDDEWSFNNTNTWFKIG